LTIFATLIKPNGADPVLMPPCVLARSLLSPSSSIFGRWSRFASERDFYRYAEAHLKEAFPTLPARSQFNRLVRFYVEDIEYIAVKLGQIMEGGEHPYQALDASAMPIRDVKRRTHGWLAGYADIGWSNSLGW